MCADTVKYYTRTRWDGRCLSLYSNQPKGVSTAACVVFCSSRLISVSPKLLSSIERVVSLATESPSTLKYSSSINIQREMYNIQQVVRWELPDYNHPLKSDNRQPSAADGRYFNNLIDFNHFNRKFINRVSRAIASFCSCVCVCVFLLLKQIISRLPN